MAGTQDQGNNVGPVAGYPEEGRGSGPEDLTREGMRLSRHGRHAEALELVGRALNEDPTYIPAWVASGFALGKL